MCGYACCNCGKCRGEASKHLASLEHVPGFCRECDFLNNPTAAVCKSCGASLADIASKAKAGNANQVFKE